jgi:hypothetical protein
MALKMKSGKLLKNFYRTAGVLSAANGLWMLISASSWYSRLPAGIPDTGPLNHHFVHDVGVAFVVIGLAFGWCASHLESCRHIHIGLTAFFAGHALIHVIEILTGHLPATHWWLDMPLVFVPALLMIIISLPGMWRVLLP